MYQLANDIDASATATWNSGAGWDPVCQDPNSDYFSGTLDGYGNAINGLFINRPGEDYIGLFGVIMYGTVKNLDLTGLGITDAKMTGGLAGAVLDGAQVQSCSTTGAIHGSSSSVGGLVGFVRAGSIDGCFSGAGVSATGHGAGGPIGNVKDASRVTLISHCHAYGNTTADNAAGGFAGGLSGATVERCYAIGNATATSGSDGYAGGFVGDAINTIVNDCYARGDAGGGDGNPDTYAGWDTTSVWDIEADAYPVLY